MKSKTLQWHPPQIAYLVADHPTADVMDRPPAWGISEYLPDKLVQPRLGLTNFGFLGLFDPVPKQESYVH
jgi:hypothetical protein